MEVQIIYGKQEAFLIYQVAIQYVNWGERHAMIMDIGGGIEFIIANHQGVKWLESYKISAQRLLERFKKVINARKLDRTGTSPYALTEGVMYHGLQRTNIH